MKLTAIIVTLAVLVGIGFVVMGRADAERAAKTVHDRVNWGPSQVVKDPASHARHSQQEIGKAIPKLDESIIVLNTTRNQQMRRREDNTALLAIGEKSLRELAAMRLQAEPGTTRTFEWQGQQMTLDELDQQLVQLNDETSLTRQNLLATSESLALIASETRRIERKKHEFRTLADQAGIQAEMHEVSRITEKVTRDIDEQNAVVDSLRLPGEPRRFLPLSLIEIRRREEFTPKPEQIQEILRQYGDPKNGGSQ